MNSLCIVTDSTAQFPKSSFPGRNEIQVISFDIRYDGKTYPEGADIKYNQIPPSSRSIQYPQNSASAQNLLIPQLASPSPERIFQFLFDLTQVYEEILVLSSAAQLCDFYKNADQAARAIKGRRPITVIDSQNISIGLGFLVQLAAEARYSLNMSMGEIDHLVRSYIPHIYTVVCIPNLFYLTSSGAVDLAQSVVGEMLGLLPIFTIEEGRLNAVDKVKNTRGVIEYFQEFLLEFEDLQHIGMIQSAQPQSTEYRLLHDYALSNFPTTSFSDHTINFASSLLIGPNTLGMMVVEKPDQSEK